MTVKVGVIMSLTGPGELSWDPVRRALDLWPEALAGVPVRRILVDDGADPARAREVALQMIDDERVDVIGHFSLSGAAFAVSPIAAARQVPHFVMSPIEVADGSDSWTFRLSPRARLMAEALIAYLARKGARTIAYVGSDDNYGNTWRGLVLDLAPVAGIVVSRVASYRRGDATLAAAEEIALSQPDAVVIGGPGNTAPMPHLALRGAGYRGLICQTFGADMRSLARSNAAFDSTVMVTGPGSVPHLLPETSPCRAQVEAFETAYRSRFGTPSASQAAISTFDFMRILEDVLPGCEQSGEGRIAGYIRDRLIKPQPIVAGSGIYRYDRHDRFGLDEEARLLVQLRGGQWRILD